VKREHLDSLADNPSRRFAFYVGRRCCSGAAATRDRSSRLHRRKSSGFMSIGMYSRAMAEMHGRGRFGEDRGRHGSTPELIRTIGVATALVFLAPAPAYAYVDPGTGAFLWQIVLVFVLGLAFRFRALASRLVERLRFWRRR
jgi:hypothetical protein